MNEKDLKIQELKMKIKKLEEEKQFIIDYINKECVYDEHLIGYCFDLPKGKVRTLMYRIKEEDYNEEN
jgi:hypothetical protein